MKLIFISFIVWSITTEFAIGLGLFSNTEWLHRLGLTIAVIGIPVCTVLGFTLASVLLKDRNS